MIKDSQLPLFGTIRPANDDELTSINKSRIKQRDINAHIPLTAGHIFEPSEDMEHILPKIFSPTVEELQDEIKRSIAWAHEKTFKGGATIQRKLLSNSISQTT